MWLLLSFNYRLDIYFIQYKVVLDCQITYIFKYCGLNCGGIYPYCTPVVWNEGETFVVSLAGQLQMVSWCSAVFGSSGYMSLLCVCCSNALQCYQQLYRDCKYFVQTGVRLEWNWMLFQCSSLGAFAKFAKNGYWFRHVCLPVCRQWTTRLSLDGFSWNLILGVFFENISRKFVIKI